MIKDYRLTLLPLCIIAAIVSGCKAEQKGPQTLEEQRAALHTEIITPEKLKQYMAQHPNTKINIPDQKSIQYPAGQ